MLKGIFVPTFTAFTANGDLDLSATIDHANWLLKTDIAGLIPFGTFWFNYAWRGVLLILVD